MTNLQDLKDVANWRILIVDDEPDNLNLASDLLKFNGATVMPTETGAQLLGAVDEMQPNVIVLDLSMPVMDGWEVQRRLRARPELVHVPIIALTALAMPEDGDRVQAAGFDGYITKPFRVGSLLRDMMACVEGFITKHTAPNVAAGEPAASSADKAQGSV